jgi:Carboxypeptidase regulatory-like domain/TonB dependent receptor-like, beta-barrel
MTSPHGPRPMRLPLVTILAAVALLALTGPSDAQILYGSVVGNVTDTSQAGVPGATVTLINMDTNLAREANTSADGTYRFVNVQPGAYKVRVVLTGFKEYVKDAVPVASTTVTRIDVALEVGALTENVTVQSEVSLLQTDTGDVHSQLRSKEIESLPLGNYRNYQSLLNLVPGTTPAGFQNAITDTPARALTTNVNGTARNNNNTRLDGTSNIYIWLPHHAVYVAPADTVDTVSMTTASFDAEQGMAGGASVTVLTKSGTNEFHGSGSWLHEDDSLRARNWANSGDKPDTKRNIGTVTLGGPILKDKLFFFGAWEGHYTTSPSTKTGTLPTAAMRAGDFSAFGTTIYDPATGNPDGTGRTPFPNNVIPAGRISSISQALQSRLPLPNAPGTSGNYTDTGLVDFTRNNFDFKVNYNPSSAAQVFAKYSQMNGTVYSDMWLGNPPDGGAGGAGFGVGSGTGDTKVRIGTVGLTWTLSPKLIVDGSFGLTRFDQECLPPDYGTNFGTDVFGIPGTNGAGGSGGDIRTSGMPGFGVSGFEWFGGVDGWTPIFRNDRSYNFSTNATYTATKHEFRFGVDVVKMELNHWQPELAYGPRGFFLFYGGPTTLAPSGSPDDFNAYAQFLLGMPSYMTKTLQHELQTGREWQYGVYIRDRFQVTKDLTLNLGVRWEKYPLMTRADRGIEYYDDTNNTVLLGGVGGNPEDLGIEVKHQHFLPRIGFSYRMGDNNVFRGGYGVTVSPIPFSRPLRGFFPATITNDIYGDSDYLAAGTLEEGIPLFYGPDAGSGVLPLPNNAGMGSPYKDHVYRGTIQSWNLTYERRLPWDMSVSAGYVGTKTSKQLGFLDINAAGVGEGQAGRPLRVAFGRTAFTWRFDGWLDSNYHSLQVALNKPFSKGFFLKGAYTFSKALNRTDDEGWSNVDWNHPSLQYKNYGPAGYDRTHIFQMGFLAELPFGKNGSGPANAIIKNWSVNGVLSAFTGRPGDINLRAPGASLNAPGNTQYPDLVGTPNKLGGIGANDPYYDPSAWAPVTEVRPGNVGRNSVRGPGWWNIDMSLFRRFNLGPRFNLEARVEAFNLTNTPHFSQPNGDNVNSGGFMTITSTSGNSPERQIRLGLRLQF